MTSPFTYSPGVAMARRVRAQSQPRSPRVRAPRPPKQPPAIAWRASTRFPLVSWTEVGGGRHMLTVTSERATFTARWVDHDDRDSGDTATGFASIAAAQNWLERKVTGLPVRRRTRIAKSRDLPRPEASPGRRATIDEERLRLLWPTDKTDAEIAETMCVSIGALRHRAKALELPLRRLARAQAAERGETP